MEEESGLPALPALPALLRCRGGAQGPAAAGPAGASPSLQEGGACRKRPAGGACRRRPAEEAWLPWLPLRPLRPWRPWRPVEAAWRRRLPAEDTRRAAAAGRSPSAEAACPAAPGSQPSSAAAACPAAPAPSPVEEASPASNLVEEEDPPCSKLEHLGGERGTAPEQADYQERDTRRAPLSFSLDPARRLCLFQSFLVGESPEEGGATRLRLTLCSNSYLFSSRMDPLFGMFTIQIELFPLLFVFLFFPFL
jgi:hypothetical protein